MQANIIFEYLYKALECPVCKTCMLKPMSLCVCPHTICDDCLERIKSTSKRCPLCSINLGAVEPKINQMLMSTSDAVPDFAKRVTRANALATIDMYLRHSNARDMENYLRDSFHWTISRSGGNTSPADCVNMSRVWDAINDGGDDIIAIQRHLVDSSAPNRLDIMVLPVDALRPFEANHPEWVTRFTVTTDRYFVRMLMAGDMGVVESKASAASAATKHRKRPANDAYGAFYRPGSPIYSPDESARIVGYHAVPNSSKRRKPLQIDLSGPSHFTHVSPNSPSYSPPL
jgi:hypothetical protein